MEQYLSNLRFADDVAHLSETSGKLPKNIEALNRESLQAGLRMKKKKTKVIFSKYAQTGKVLERVNEYVYSGQLTQTTPTLDPEIERCILLDCRTFVKQSNMLMGFLPLCFKR